MSGAMLDSRLVRPARWGRGRIAIRLFAIVAVALLLSVAIEPLVLAAPERRTWQPRSATGPSVASSPPNPGGFEDAPEGAPSFQPLGPQSPTENPDYANAFSAWTPGTV